MRIELMLVSVENLKKNTAEEAFPPRPACSFENGFSTILKKVLHSKNRHEKAGDFLWSTRFLFQS